MINESIKYAFAIIQKFSETETAVSRLSPVTMIDLRFAVLSSSMMSVLVGFRLFLNVMNPMN